MQFPAKEARHQLWYLYFLNNAQKIRHIGYINGSWIGCHSRAIISNPFPVATAYIWSWFSTIDKKAAQEEVIIGWGSTGWLYLIHHYIVYAILLQTFQHPSWRGGEYEYNCRTAKKTWRLDFWYRYILDSKYVDEPSIFDFKEVLNATHPEKGTHAASIRRTVCSLSNADGGYILFGVRDRNKPASTLEARIPGILLERDLRKKFQEKIASLQRPVQFNVIPSPILLPTNSQRGIFVVFIPQSPLRPETSS